MRKSNLWKIAKWIKLFRMWRCWKISSVRYALGMHHSVADYFHITAPPCFSRYYVTNNGGGGVIEILPGGL